MKYKLIILFLITQNFTVHTMQQFIETNDNKSAAITGCLRFINAATRPINNMKLILAAKRGDLRTINELLSKTANVNTVDNKHGRTALIYASNSGYTEIVNTLLDNGADTNIADHKQNTALSLATRSGYTEIVKSLLAKGANVNTEDYWNFTPLIYSALYKNTDILRILLKAGAKIPDNSNLFEKSIQKIIEEEKTIRKERRFVKLSDAKSKKLTLKTTTNPNPIFIGVQTKIESIKEKDNLNDLLIIASQKNYSTVANTLCINGADVNSTDKEGYTPLIYSAMYGYNDIAKILLDRDANINVVDPNGNTPIIFCARNGNIELLNILISKGADVNAADNGGYTALMYAAIYTYSEIAKILLQNGASIDNTDNYRQYTALIHALKSGHKNTIKILLDAGANIPKDLTIYSKNIRELLESAQKERDSLAACTKSDNTYKWRGHL